MSKIIDIMSERFNEGDWEIGDEEAIVLNDAVLILSLTETGPEVKILAGEYIKKDINLNLTKKEVE